MLYGQGVGERMVEHSLTSFWKMERQMEYHMICFLVLGIEPIVSHINARPTTGLS